jgi:hypothetical protein
MAPSEQVAEYLVSRRGHWYCDDCLAHRLRFPHQRWAQSATDDLVDRDDYSRERGACEECRRDRVVTAANQQVGVAGGGGGARPLSPLAPNTRTSLHSPSKPSPIPSRLASVTHCPPGGEKRLWVRSVSRVPRDPIAAAKLIGDITAGHTVDAVGDAKRGGSQLNRSLRFSAAAHAASAAGP